jgi:hypothetical protein
MKKKKILLIGYGKWGKKIFLKLKKFNQFEIVVYTKKKKYIKKNFFLLKDIKSINIENIYAIICATNIGMHEKIIKFSAKKKIPLFVEKPITTNNNFFSKIKLIKNKKIIWVNYIYSKYLDKIKIKKKNIKKIILIFGSIGKNKSFYWNKWEWLTHLFSIIIKILNITKSVKILFIKNRFNNFSIILKWKSTKIYIHYGDNFLKKTRLIKLIYKNTIKKINFSSKNIIFSKTEHDPLEWSLINFFRKINTNYKYDLNISRRITALINKIS